MASYGITVFIESIDQFLFLFFLFKVLLLNLELLSEVLTKMANPTGLTMVILHYVGFQNTCNEAVCFPLVSSLTVFHPIPVIPVCY